jgi:hypothetical protein
MPIFSELSASSDVGDAVDYTVGLQERQNRRAKEGTDGDVKAAISFMSRKECQ